MDNEQVTDDSHVKEMSTRAWETLRFWKTKTRWVKWEKISFFGGILPLKTTSFLSQAKYETFFRKKFRIQSTHNTADKFVLWKILLNISMRPGLLIYLTLKTYLNTTMVLNNFLSYFPFDVLLRKCRVQPIRNQGLEETDKTFGCQKKACESVS